MSSPYNGGGYPNQHRQNIYNPSYAQTPQHQQYSPTQNLPLHPTMPATNGEYFSQPNGAHPVMHYANDPSSSNYAQPQPHQMYPNGPYTFPNYSQPSQFQMQMQQYASAPPSPASDGNGMTTEQVLQHEETARRTFTCPDPESRTFDAHYYELKVAQEPVRARMCGFGDKDRRPISTAPIVQAVVFDEKTRTEIDYKNTEFEVSHFVCQVHIYDKTGKHERSVVKTTQGQQIISASHISNFPSAPLPQEIGRVPPLAPLTNPSYPRSQGSHNHSAQHIDHNLPGPYPSPASASSFGATGANNFGPAPSPYGMQSHAPSAMHAQMLSAGPPTPPHGRNEDIGSGFSRNLIGSHAASGQLLQDINDEWGIFFVFPDLSVRSEEWFRLKFTLFNLCESTTGVSNQELFRRAEENNTAPSAGTEYEIGRSGSRRPEGVKSGLVAKLAPCLATVFSQPFKVYSAKRFPGVVESTPLSAKFAKQGVKISVRKDTQGAKRKRNNDGDNDDSGDDQVET